MDEQEDPYLCVGICMADPDSGYCLGCGRPPVGSPTVVAEAVAAGLPVVATGGYAALMAAKLPEITAVDPLLTLEGLRLVWEGNDA